uniref:Reverse transcriptase domain-containing protein n=1 Tax=Peronospora matthiolae TaxID=2874970 RepID=A0AAV1UCY8_9STRA
MGDPTGPAGLGPPPHAAFQRTLLNTVVRSVTSLDRDILDAPVTATDLAAAIHHMRATSSPGMDGMTAGFYQVAPDVFGDCLSIDFKDRLHRGTLLPSQRKSAVVLLHKKGSRAAPGNYRPIALVQVDVKILSKALTYRLQQLIPDLIHPYQKGFVKGRSIHHHVRFLADLQDLVTGRNDEAYAMFLDFEKAFDRVIWDYMFRLLERMGFGTTFTRWIRLLYTDPRAHLMINQNIQPALFPTRGVKQGDPLSFLLFILTIEPLGNLLRKHEGYGVCLNAEHTATGTFFADDSTLLSSSIANLQDQLLLVQDYCLGSGAKLNLQKSVLLALNRNHTCPLLPAMRVHSRTDTVKYLGIPFGQSSVDTVITDLLEQRFYDGFKLWYRRARKLRGRLLVAQTMILSRLWHYTQHVSISTITVRRWQSMLNRFVLSRKHHRKSSHILPCAFLCQRCCEGGLGFPDLAAHLKRQRLQLLLHLIRGLETPSVRDWTTASSELTLTLIPSAGRRHALDFLTISPLRHGDIIKWGLASAWWKAAWKLWTLSGGRSRETTFLPTNALGADSINPYGSTRTWLSISRHHHDLPPLPPIAAVSAWLPSHNGAFGCTCPASMVFRRWRTSSVQVNLGRRKGCLSVATSTSPMRRWHLGDKLYGCAHSTTKPLKFWTGLRRLGLFFLQGSSARALFPIYDVRVGVVCAWFLPFPGRRVSAWSGHRRYRHSTIRCRFTHLVREA